MPELRYFAFLIGYLTLASMLISVIVYEEAGLSVGGFVLSNQVTNSSYDFTTYNQSGDAETILPEGSVRAGDWYLDSSGLRCDRLNFWGYADYVFLGISRYGGGMGYVTNTYLIENPNHGEFSLIMYSDSLSSIIAKIGNTGTTVRQITQTAGIVTSDTVLISSANSYYTLDSLRVTTDLNPTAQTVKVMVNDAIVIQSPLWPGDAERWNGLSINNAYYAGVRPQTTGFILKQFSSSSIPGGGSIGGGGESMFSWARFLNGIVACLSWGITDPVLLQLVPFPIIAFFIGVPEIALGAWIIMVARGV